MMIYNDEFFLGGGVGKFPKILHFYFVVKVERIAGSFVLRSTQQRTEAAAKRI